jgi:orotate phosphoribosyltransferase
LLGGPIEDGDRVVIIEDVTTAGTSIRETLPIIQAAADAKVLGLVVSVDRCERGTGTKSALDEIQESFGIRTSAIVTMKEVIQYLTGTVIDEDMKAKIDAYYEKYGCQ